jgi:acetyl esterase/lipase
MRILSDLLASVADFVNDTPDWLAAAVPELAGLLRPSPDVVKRTHLAHRSGPGGDADRHRLDVYAPAGKTGFPVLVFAHGGAWMFGTNDWFGPLGRSLAKAGIDCVAANYRLSPRVIHPAHAEDMAGAVAWAVRNAGEYGGDPNRVFAGGHSAGGHLAALVALDPKYPRGGGVAADRGSRGRRDQWGVQARPPAPGVPVRVRVRARGRSGRLSGRAGEGKPAALSAAHRGK